MRAVVLAALLLTAGPVLAGSLTPAQQKVATEAFEEIELTAEHCQMGTQYDGGPKLTQKEIDDACRRYETAKNTLAKMGIYE